jgi:hypothetical protein
MVDKNHIFAPARPYRILPRICITGPAFSIGTLCKKFGALCYVSPSVVPARGHTGYVSPKNYVQNYVTAFTKLPKVA